MDTRYGKGESGLKPMSAEKYHEIVSDEVAMTVLTVCCRHYNVDEPEIYTINENNGRWHGLYKPREREVQVSRLMVGLIVHEVAHHITSMTYGRLKRNGYHVHHGPEYKEVLQELHNLWK